MILYLNPTEDYEGGETEFVRLKKKIKLKQGDALVFYNLDENRNVRQDSLHRGCQVKTGEKWIANVWVRKPPKIEITKTIIELN